MAGPGAGREVSRRASCSPRAGSDVVDGVLTRIRARERHDGPSGRITAGPTSAEKAVPAPQSARLTTVDPRGCPTN